MTKVTLKEIKELQIELDSSIAVDETINNELKERISTKLDDWYSGWFLRHSDAWKKSARLSAKLGKLKRKYWEEHGIQG